MHPDKLTTFSDLAKVITDLPVIVRNVRRSRGLSVRAVGRAIGVSMSTISRIENGEDCNTVSLVAVLRWLDSPDDRGPSKEVTDDHA